jgi:hypothetical protein
MNFREWLSKNEWINYQPPPVWVQTAAEKMFGGIGRAIQGGLENAAEKAGGVAPTNPGKFSVFDQPAGLTQRLTMDDRTWLAKGQYDVLYDRPRYFLIKIQLPGLHSSALALQGRNHILNLPAVKKAVEEDRLDTTQMKLMQTTPGVAKHDQNITTYYYRIVK